MCNCNIYFYFLVCWKNSQTHLFSNKVRSGNLLVSTQSGSGSFYPFSLSFDWAWGIDERVDGVTRWPQSVMPSPSKLLCPQVLPPILFQWNTYQKEVYVVQSYVFASNTGLKIQVKIHVARNITGNCVRFSTFGSESAALPFPAFSWLRTWRLCDYNVQLQ